MKARDRMIRIGFYQNEVVGKLSPLAALLLPGLWQLADREGRLENRPDRIKAMLFPYRDKADITKLLKELSETTPPFISFYEGGKYFHIHNFKKHQPIHNHEAKSELPEPTELNRKAVVGVDTCTDMSLHVDTSQPCPPCPVSSNSSNDSNNDSNTKSNNRAQKDTRKPIVRFNEWIKENQEGDLTAMIRSARGLTGDGLLSEQEWRWGKYQIDKMRTWIIGNPEQGDKKKWGRFVSNWLNTEVKNMTEQDEETFKITEQRGPSEPTLIGDLR